MIQRVWSYWEGPRNDLVDLCVQSWRTYLPHWEVTILNDDTSKRYRIDKPASYANLSVQAKSDVIRLSLLYHYGGVWMDASTLLNKDFSWMKTDTPIVGFKLFNKNYIESWFLMVNTVHDSSIGAWLEQTNRRMDNPKRVCSEDPTYFMIYDAFCEVDTMFEDKMTLYPAETPTFNIYNCLYPISANRLVKFTASGRRMWKYTQFPLLYVYLLLFVVILIFVRMQKNN